MWNDAECVTGRLIVDIIRAWRARADADDERPQ
jgi:hypothetical protein